MPVRLSICIPSFNRREKLSRLLTSINESVSELQGADHRFEVIVVLDGSTDGSVAMLNQHGESSPVPLRYVWQPNSGLSAARNRLVKEAKGELVWFLDDDMRITAATAEAHLLSDRQHFAVISGPSFVVGSQGLAEFYNTRWQALRESGEVTEPNQMSFANTSAPRDLLLDHPFDESFVGYGFEDYELAIRMFASKVRIGYNHDAAVTHYYDRTQQQMLRNIREEGVNRVRVAELHPLAGEFALSLLPCEFNDAANWLTRHGRSGSLWFGAYAFWYLSYLFPHKPHGQYRLRELSKALAVRSGVALARP